MSSLWNNIGYIHWPLLFSILAIVGLTAWAGVRLFREDATADLRTKAWLDAVLFWGGFAMVTGLLGTLLGVIVAAQSIERAGAVESTLVWGGIKIAMSSVAIGVVILSVAALLWFVLQLRWRLLEAKVSEGRA